MTSSNRIVTRQITIREGKEYIPGWEACNKEEGVDSDLWLCSSGKTEDEAIKNLKMAKYDSE